MRLVSIVLPALAIVGVAAPTLAQMTPAPMSMPTTGKGFVAKAGASDKFEIDEANMMMGSKDPQIRMIAQHMVDDHTDSTTKIKAAAMSDGIKPMPPVLSSKQRANIASLRAKTGAEKDALYLRQQLPAHQEALALMQGYSSSGTSPMLKQAAGMIAPVVQGHIDMIQSAQTKMTPGM
jgi:putative membrane protein